MKLAVDSVEGEDSALSSAILDLLGAEIESGELPSASWLVIRADQVMSRGALGLAVAEAEKIAASPTTVYDLASLTKPLVTTTLALLAAAEGQIDLDDTVRRVVPELSSSAHLAEATWADLLAHRAGLEAWYPLYVDGRDRTSYLATLLSRPAAYVPRSSVVYSDLGFILIFIALERLWGADFETLTRTRVFDPLGIDSGCFRPAVEQRRHVAATERGNEKEREMVHSRGLAFQSWREGVIWGEVNDANAHYLGGVSGHAGLFGDTECVGRLSSVYLPGRNFLPEAMRARALECQAESGGERRGFGWQLRTATNAAAALPASACGHTGFTGTSVWIDPDSELVIVLLTNRIHPRVRDSRIQEIRRTLNEVVAEAYL